MKQYNCTHEKEDDESKGGKGGKASKRKSGKSKKRKAGDSCTTCLGRGRVEQSKTHSDQYCAHPGGPYEGDWRKAKAIKTAEEEALHQVQGQE